MKTIICKTCGGNILVDDTDYERLSKHSWYCSNGKSVETPVTGGTCCIARLVIDVPTGYIPDHKDGNTHNNQADNLRVATYSQNAQNRKVRLDSSSGYKGVFANKFGGRPTGKWTAYITENGKTKSLGSFPTAREAAAVYDKAAKEKYGEFARTNLKDRI